MAASSAVRREVRWRVTGTTAWSDIASCSPVAELTLEGLNRDKTYDVEVRDVSACGAPSEWVLHTAVIPDANQRIDNGNINMLRTGGIGSAWTGFSISYKSTSTSATISCTSGTLQDGAGNPSYAASAAMVSGTVGTTVSYFMYYDDPNGAGGSLALGVATSYSDLSANQGRVYVGQVDVDYPASGTGGGGGVPGGGGGCVVIDMWLLAGLRAGRVQVGQSIDGATYDPIGQVDRIVETNMRLRQPCLRLVTESGCVVEASRSTPMTMPDGSVCMLPDMLGQPALVNDHGDIRWERVTELQDIGLQWVVWIRMNNQCFFAGAEADRRVATHNLIAAK